VSHWWRWALRAVALLALVGAGLQLALHPTPHYPPPGSQTIHWCLSPFDRLKGETDRNEVPFFHSVSPAQLQYLLAGVSTCDAATRDQEHAAEALGAIAVVLVGLSLAPRRRRTAASSQNLVPSPQ